MAERALPLPSSFSPHICVLPSPELEELLKASNQPELHHLFHHLSPIPEVTTRTTTLTPVRHAKFNVRFSSFSNTSSACKEEPASRSSRILDWISARISGKAARWVQDLETVDTTAMHSLPWWDELKECIDSDTVPNPYETWNHPTAALAAVSTRSPNPLQELESLHSQITNTKWPVWVEKQIFRCSLVVSDEQSTFSGEEATALANAIRKQYGHPVFFANLDFSPTDEPAEKLTIPPSLPLHGVEDNLHLLSISSHNVSSQNLEELRKFLREFIAMNLIPWMEKMTLDWGELYPARRLTSRLFSSTRRLFGTPPPQMASHSSSQSELVNPTDVLNASAGTQRRLAEFATILGDYKVAFTTWDTLRKEKQNGMEMFPILMVGMPDPRQYIVGALKSVMEQMPTPIFNFLSVTFAVKWEAGVPNFASLEVGGAHWLAAACSLTDEAVSAIMLGHAAHVSERSNPTARRRAAMWYTSAADRLEIHGIKPITRFFIQQADRLYQSPPRQMLSPAFNQSEFLGHKQRPKLSAASLHAIHLLGRLYYATGEIQKSLNAFYELFQLVTASNSTISDEYAIAFLDDFEVAYQHGVKCLGELPPENSNFHLRLVDCNRIKLDIYESEGLLSSPTSLLESWEDFRSQSRLPSLDTSRSVEVGEIFSLHLHLFSPLTSEISLGNLSLVLDLASRGIVEVDGINGIVLAPLTSSRISFRIRALQAGVCTFRALKYRFLDLFEAIEPLNISGRRLNDTLPNMRRIAYAPSTHPSVKVEECRLRLDAGFFERSSIELFSGECKEMNMKLRNIGKEDISRLWIVLGKDDGLFLLPAPSEDTEWDIWNETRTFKSNLSNNPRTILNVSRYLPNETALKAGESCVLPLAACYLESGEHDIQVLLISESFSGRYRSSSLSKHVRVSHAMEFSCYTGFSPEANDSFRIALTVNNMEEEEALEIMQISTLSQGWGGQQCDVGTPESQHNTVLGKQTRHFKLEISSRSSSSRFGSSVPDFAALLGLSDADSTEASQPDITHATCYKGSALPQLLQQVGYSSWHLERQSRRRQDWMFQSSPMPSIWPSMHPNELDLIVFWRLGSREGATCITGLTVGGCNLDLDSMLSSLEESAQRSLYAAGRIEKHAKVEALRNSVWNEWKDPAQIVFSYQQTSSHDFQKGPLQFPLTIHIYNVSPTHGIDFTFNIKPSGVQHGQELNLPNFVGRQSFSGQLSPSSKFDICTSAWIKRPGIYHLAGWLLVAVIKSTTGFEALKVVHQHPNQGTVPAFEIRSAGPARLDICSVAL